MLAPSAGTERQTAECPSSPASPPPISSGAKRMEWPCARGCHGQGGYTVTCRTASNHLVYAEPIDPSACSPECKMSLQLVEDQRGYNITLRSSRNDSTLEAKTFHLTQCPPGWLASGRSCYSVRRRALTWGEAQRSCKRLAAGSHLADLKTPDDLLFVSSHLLSHNSLLLLWTGLSDQQVPAIFSFDLVQVTEQQVELRWSDFSPLSSLDHSSFEIFLQYQKETNGVLGQSEDSRSRTSEEKKGTQSPSSVEKIVKVPITLSSRGVTVAGPLPPQNLTVGSTTVSQIRVHWMLPDVQCVAGWTFVVRYVDMSSRQQRIVGMADISWMSETGGSQSYTAVIGGLASHRKYMVDVYTVTQHGIESCGQVPVTVQTGLVPPSRVREGVVTDSSIELLWDPAQGRAHSYEVICLNFPEVPQEVALSEHVVTSVFVTWRPPPGQVECYKLVFGLLSTDKSLWIEVLLLATSYEIRDLIPGSDYGVNIQSVLGSDRSQVVHREFSTRPAGLCKLHLGNVYSSSVSVSWDGAIGDFDFYRVTVANASVTSTLAIPKEEQVAVVTGLVDGCSYNVSAERVRGVTAGSAAFLTVTTVPARVRRVRVVNVSARAFSLRWEQAVGCVDHYQVSLLPNQGKVTVHRGHDGYVQVTANCMQLRWRGL
ncbi:putative phosphatidylinositol phosphatase PTPRQ [Scophthalmus maximus]|uniref:Putative phosphatidylinositol phosphatase PTPRQ n=1 Tax=Scophthalmus maximus TaxID=52904 RepID=A0A2U9BXF5_SCOMX|nr:putative phosphatidylinositol phosphatase PTPRQ [Scophthalmus maximus]